MMSESVAEFLTKKLKQLPSDTIETLKVLSCFGQVDMITIQVLDRGQFVLNMIESLESAMEVGFIDRAGPIFAFSHDMLQESACNLIPIDEKMALHKKLTMSLVQDAKIAENAEIYTLAVNQINTFQDLGGVLKPEDCCLFAQLNLVAGKYSMSTKNPTMRKVSSFMPQSKVFA